MQIKTRRKICHLEVASDNQILLIMVVLFKLLFCRRLRARACLLSKEEVEEEEEMQKNKGLTS